MQRFHIKVILILTLFISGCFSVKMPFTSDTKEQTVKVKSVERIKTYCYVRKGENPCEKCENVMCQGGR